MYRLRLAENDVDPRGAFVCYGHCREKPTQAALLECLSECPGFEVTHDARCSASDRLPKTFCLTQSTKPKREPLPAGGVVLAVVMNVALIVGLATLCGSANPTCFYPSLYPY